MGKGVLIIVSGYILIFSLTNFNIFNANTGMFNEAVEYYDNYQTKNIAASGIEIAVSNLGQDPTWSGFSNKVFNNLGYTLTVNLQTTTSKYPKGVDMSLTDHLEIESIARIGDIIDTVYAVVNMGAGSGGTPSFPPYMEYAMISDWALAFSGYLDLFSSVGSNLNPNIHTNSSFANAGFLNSSGFVTYVTTGIVGGVANINPNVNPDGLDPVRKADYVEIPNLDLTTFQSSATNYFSGNTTKNGNISLGTKESPAIWYVDGDLTIDGDVSGYGNIICTGNLTINGDFDLSSSDVDGSNVGLYAGKSAFLSSTGTIKAQIYTKEHMFISGDLTVEGQLICNGTLQYSGYLDLIYKPPLAEVVDTIIPVGGGGGGLPIIVSYYGK